MKSSQKLERQARVFALAGDVTRLKILSLLARNNKVKVSDIAKEVDMGIACVSHHLQLLKDNQILKSSRSGNSIFYQLNDDKLAKSLINLIV